MKTLINFVFFVLAVCSIEACSSTRNTTSKSDSTHTNGTLPSDSGTRTSIPRSNPSGK